MTAQTPERIIIDGVGQDLAACPEIPELPGRLVLRENSERLLAVTSTCLWRAYIATWQIHDGRFYLLHVDGIYEKTDPAPILADWFSGELRVNRGRMLRYVHAGFGSQFEFERHFRIENGLVVEEWTIDNREEFQRQQEREFRIQMTRYLALRRAHRTLTQVVDAHELEYDRSPPSFAERLECRRQGIDVSGSEPDARRHILKVRCERFVLKDYPKIAEELGSTLCERIVEIINGNRAPWFERPTRPKGTAFTDAVGAATIFNLFLD